MSIDESNNHLQNLQRIVQNQQEEIKRLSGFEERLNAMLECVVGLCWWKDINGVYQGCNKATLQVVGVNSREEIIGKTDYELPWAKYAEAMIKNDKLVMESGLPIHDKEEIMVDYNGNSHTLLIAKTPIRDNAGNIIGTMGNSVDITLLRQLEKELIVAKEKAERSSELKSNQLNAVLECVAGMCWWKDINGVYQGCNKIALQAAGLDTADDMIGKTDYELPWAEQAEAMLENDRIVIETGVIIQGKEEILIDQNGGEHVLLVGKAPIRDYTGKIIGTMGNSIDITIQKNLEKELRQAKENAERSNELIRKFIQNMQHDMRTPLVGIYSYLEDLANTIVDEEQKTLFKYMASSAAQLLNMCNEIIDFDNINYLSEDIKLEPVNMRRLLNRVLDLYNVAAHMRGLSLNLHINSDVPEMLKLDKHRVIHTLENLTGNALKFTDEGSITLQARLVEMQGNKATVAFEVHDTGIGIPQDKLPLIFEKFVKLNPSNQAKYKGSGLGLAYVKKFVEDLHGQVEVESIEGQGSTFRVIFTFDLPALGEKEVLAEREIDTYDESIARHEINKLPDERFNKKAAVSPIKEDIAVNAPNVEKTKPQLLLIEDDLILQKTIAKKFQEKGCDVVATVDSVSKSCIAIKAQKYDLVVCDLGINEGTGIDVMNWAKQDKAHPNQDTPFVVLTANADPVMQQKAIESGFLTVFQKPLEDADAKKIIDSYIGKPIPPAKTPSEQKIIDIDATLAINSDVVFLKEIFAVLVESVLEDKATLQNYYHQNDIRKTLELLMRLDGTLRSYVAPPLQASRAKLMAAVKETHDLKTLTPLYDEFYNQIDIFRKEYTNLKSQGKL